MLCFKKRREVFYLDSVKGFHQFFFIPPNLKVSQKEAVLIQVTNKWLRVARGGKGDTHHHLKDRHDIDLPE